MLSGFLQRSWSLTGLKKIRLNRELKSLDFFHTGNCLCQEKKKKRGFWPWSGQNDEDEDKIKITPPQKCAETGIPILDPECKVAIILGGAADIGIRAADSLLYHGARAVILVDDDARVGEHAARSLCDFYGKNRARFYRCSFGSPCQFEGIIEDTICKFKAVHVLFSNLDRSNRAKSSPCGDIDNQMSNTMRAINTGIQYMGKKNGGKGGIIVNAASILGFMGWPIDPTPVYCSKEPVVETTMDLAKIYPFEKTGVRLVALLKSNKPFTEIGLPLIPVINKNGDAKNMSQYCDTSIPSRIGEALIHIMARAKNGTTWLSEPAPCVRETPWLIHFPAGEGKTVDPKIYEKSNYSPLESHCVVKPASNCPAGCPSPQC